MEKDERLVAIEMGMVPYDSRTEIYVISASLDLVEAKRDRDTWYHMEYLPARKRGDPIEYMNFDNWLRSRCGAREPRDDEIEMFVEEELGPGRH